jgi:hypothetical protein
VTNEASDWARQDTLVLHHHDPDVYLFSLVHNGIYPLFIRQITSSLITQGQGEQTARAKDLTFIACASISSGI